LSYALGSRAKVACLRVLAGSDALSTQRALARRAGVQHRSAQLALDELVELGIVRRIQGGRDHLVGLNRDHALAPALRELFRSESEFFLALRAHLTTSLTSLPHRHRPEGVALFGSVARGDDRPGSDVDVVVFTAGEGELDAILAHFAGVAEEIRVRYGRVVRTIAYTVSDARRRWRRGEAPFTGIMQDHILLAGRPLSDLIGGTH
jgi:predicted nucleotidyltransferase